MNDDTISRQAAIEALTRFTNLSWDKLKIIYPMLTVIEELPSAERLEAQSSECKHWDSESNFCALHRPSAERRGRWVSQEYMSEIDSFIYTEYKCSNCGEVSKKKSNYCPNCGAKLNSSAAKGE